jgi:hypothetical protein
MGTRSTIALEFADGSVEQVYCHWDGYLAYNGKILFENYNNPFILRDLIDLGDLSSLRPMVGTKHAFSHYDTDLKQEQYYELYGDMCTFYGRDRGETRCDKKKFLDFQDYLAHHQYEEYEYILRRDGNWYVKQHDNEYELLVAALVKELTEETAE